MMSLYKIYSVVVVLSVMKYSSMNISAMDLCSVCKCRDTEYDVMTITCDGVHLQQFPTEWPKDFVNEDTCKDKTLTITFKSNNLTKLEQLPQLQCKQITLFIENNHLEKIAYAAFKNMKNMHYLSLGQDQLTSDIVRGDIFRGPYNDRLYEPLDVQVLHLSDNRLHSLSNKMFDHTPYLRHLYLANNPMGMLDSITIATLSSLHKLETLDLSNTGISTLPDQMMKNMKQLKDLRLSGNKFTTVPESLGFVGATLRKLVFDDNMIEELNDNSFLGLWRLETLEIGAMDTLTRVKSDAFGQLVSLKMLHLCHNKNLKEIDHNAFQNLKDKWVMQELYIHDNGLTSIAGELVPWDQLASVNLDDNPWECDCRMVTTIERKGLKKLIPPTSTPRCLTPLEMAGRPLSTLKMEMTCFMTEVTNKTSHIVAPQFMKGIMNRPRNTFIGFIFVCGVVVFGMMTGWCVTKIKSKLKKNVADQPIRYRHILNNT